MNELGQMLRAAREGQDISLAEAETQTRIRQKFIAAMEAEEWDLLPNEVTTRGFLRKYTAYLGLDEDAVLQLFQNRAKGAAPQPVMATPVAREVDYRPIEMNLASEPRRAIPWGWIGAVVVLLLLAGLALYLRFYQPNFVANILDLPRTLPNPSDIIALEPTTTPTATVLVNRITATPTATPNATATAIPTSPVTRTEPAGEAETPTPAGETPGVETPSPVETPSFRPVEQIELALEAVARTWVRVVTDNNLALEAVLEPGEQRTWQAMDFITVRTGNAAGIQLVLNGQMLSPLGGSGEVIEVQWRLVDGQIVQSTPTPLPPAQPAPELTPTPEEASGG